MLITTPRWAANDEVRHDMAAWRILGSPLSDMVARTIARCWGDPFESAPNLRALGHGKEFDLAGALEECLILPRRARTHLPRCGST
jgi:hypothetical protein